MTSLTLPTHYNGDDPQPLEMTRAQWLGVMRGTWKQGQHIAIMGRTGRGKTTLSRDLDALRGYVVVVAIKMSDETLDLFPKYGFEIIKKWPPRYGQNHVILWAKAKSLGDMAEQRAQIRKLLDDVFANGGWTVDFDDIARVANALGFKKDISTLLNEARSHYSSIISKMTQPSSVTQAIPSETWRQVRFIITFYYRVGRDLDAIADIVGYSKSQLSKLMKMLRRFDFLVFDDLTDSVTIVRA